MSETRSISAKRVGGLAACTGAADRAATATPAATAAASLGFAIMRYLLDCGRSLSTRDTAEARRWFDLPLACSGQRPEPGELTHLPGAGRRGGPALPGTRPRRGP